MHNIPHFRLTRRLRQWMSNNSNHGNRLPKDVEEVFFKSKESADTIASNLVNYANETYNEPLSVELENLILKSPKAVVNYLTHLKYRHLPIRDVFIQSLKGHPHCLAQAAASVGRLPRELESEIVNADHFLTYVGSLRNNGKSQRIIEQEPAVFFSGNNSPAKVAEAVANYAGFIGVLPPELKELLKANNNAIMSYANFLKNQNMSLDSDLVDCLAGDDENLFKYAQNYLRKRLPEHLEKTFTDPSIIVNYARNIVRGRLPEELENHLASDYRAAASYAFDVIRGFACVRLPDVVHSAMVMKSFETPNEPAIKRYIQECEKDTTISGSFVGN